MKKLSVLLVAAIMVLALTMPALAFENEFGGYWRTRAFSNWNFTGEDQTKRLDTERIDTRTRLYYTAKFSDNLKFVNKFEMNASWGGSVGTMSNGYGTGKDPVTAGSATYGQLAADGANLVVKASYVDFKLAQQRFTVGVQDFALARSYLFDDDAAGIKAIFKVNDALYLPLIYMKLYEGGTGKVPAIPTGTNADNYDVDAYVFYPSIFLTKDNVLKPHLAYLVSENFSRFQTKALTNAQLNPLSPLGATKLNAWTYGLEYDGKFDIFTIGATAIGEAGDVTVNPLFANGHDKINLKGFLFDVRGGVDLGPANIHAKGIYASGDGKNDFVRTGDDWGFFVPGYSNNVGANINNYDQANWAEIMGCGMFDYQFPSGALGTQISNAIIGGIGGSYKLIQDLKFSADLWYAQAADSVYMPTTRSNSDSYGTELDLKVTYMLVDNLKLDLVGAYLWAGDIIAKSSSAANSANPIEIGAQLSLAF
jgi:hypothetical protein